MIFNKILPLFFLPLSIATLLTALAAWRKSRWLALFAPLFLLFWSLPAISDFVLESLENRYPQILPTAAPTASSIVVLSGSLHDPAPGRPLDWNSAVNRFERGLDLYRAAKAPVVVFTGGIVLNGRSAAGPLTEGDYLRDAAIARGIPPSAILTTSDVRNTQEEAAAVAALASRNHWSRILLVTSAFHLPRAVLLFQQAGLDVVPFPAGYLAQNPALHLEFDLLRYLPDPEALRNSQLTLREYMGIGYYRFYFRVLRTLSVSARNRRCPCDPSGRRSQRASVGTGFRLNRALPEKPSRPERTHVARFTPPRHEDDSKHLLEQIPPTRAPKPVTPANGAFVQRNHVEDTV
jgi:uncharacterized SAM-binding protein YcdF (DUF218 family)